MPTATNWPSLEICGRRTANRIQRRLSFPVSGTNWRRGHQPRCRRRRPEGTAGSSAGGNSSPRCAGVDLLLTVGGASVGDRDLMRPVLADLGFCFGFERIAMRPGKPTSFGWLHQTPVLILPGNPVSAAVCALRLAKPILERLLGIAETDDENRLAVLGRDLDGNDAREDHLRAVLSVTADGRPEATPFERQDSAMSSLLAAADCLIIRPAHAPAAKRGDLVPIISFDDR
ncbi:MAG: hypothetical protein HC834_08095 [Rhodospirillales bacterium]|nr:hypothetical protein [Rhodospirillales bacterium]